MSCVCPRLIPGQALPRNNAHDCSIGSGKRVALIDAVWGWDFRSRKVSPKRTADACGWSPRWVQAARFILRCRWPVDACFRLTGAVVTGIRADTEENERIA